MAIERRQRGDLETCIGRYLLDPVITNVYSALAKAFVECYVELKSEDYVSSFTRVVAERLAFMYSCERLREILRMVAGRLNTVATALACNKEHALYEIQLTTWSRLLVGSRGGPLPFEITISWDPMFNVPFIPSSSIKGATRAYFESQVGSIGNYTVHHLFGFEESEGLVKFTDAFPVACKNRLLEPEVITPHYSEVAGNIDEASSRPVPIVFLVVPPGVTFRLFMVIKGARTETTDTVAKKVAEALSRGIGAKTMLGYGLFTSQYTPMT